MLVIRTEGLTRRFGDVVAVRGLDLEIASGGGVGLVGLRIPRKPITQYARMPITDSAHADHPRSEATLGGQLVAD